MKTIKEWFNDLPEDVREKALRNTDDLRLESTELSLKSALIGAFAWEDTPEGGDYWGKIYTSL